MAFRPSKKKGSALEKGGQFAPSKGLAALAALAEGRPSAAALLDEIAPGKPRWAQVRATLQDFFPNPFNVQDDFTAEVKASLDQLQGTRPPEGGPAYLGSPGSEKGPDYDTGKTAKIPSSANNLSDVVNDLVSRFDGMPIWSHPLTVTNVIPPANKASIIAAMMTEIYSPNIIEGEYSWNVEFSEIESAAMLANLIGWDPTKAGGLFTYGGSGCYLYGLKWALTNVLPDSRKKGIRTDGKWLVSYQGHYCKYNNTDWCGLGTDNIVNIRTDPETNAMDTVDLEAKLKSFQAEKIPVIGVCCTMGSTDAFAIDNPKLVRALLDKYPNPAPYGPAMIYCDAVIGWSWLAFKDYDFRANPLDFSATTLLAIQANLIGVQNIHYADAVGCDFHKVGWGPYNCSIFLARNYWKQNPATKTSFQEKMARPGSDYLQERTSYNPGLYTLEVSRSSSYSIAGYAALNYFGIIGFQALLGGILEAKEYLRSRLANLSRFVSANDADNGFDTIFRIYPNGVDAKTQYNTELNQESAKEALHTHNLLQQQVANTLWAWFRSGKKLPSGAQSPYTGLTTGFRPTNYNPDWSDQYYPIFGIKAFPMNSNVDNNSMDVVIEAVQEACDAVVATDHWKETERSIREGRQEQAQRERTLPTGFPH